MTLNTPINIKYSSCAVETDRFQLTRLTICLKQHQYYLIVALMSSSRLSFPKFSGSHCIQIIH